MGITSFIPGFSYVKLLGGIAVAGVIFAGYTMLTNHLDEDEKRDKILITQDVKIDNLEKQAVAEKHKTELIVQQFQFTSERDRNKAKKIKELEKDITSDKKRKQLANLKDSRRATLVLRVINRSAACEWKHFEDYDGVCKGGVWKIFSDE